MADESSTANTKLELPPIPLLKGEANFEEWRNAAEIHAQWFELEGFLDGSEVCPATATSEQEETFRRRKLLAYSMIKYSITPVIDFVKSSGWQQENEDPKTLWDIVNKTIPSISNEHWTALIEKISTMDVERYSDLEAYLRHFHRLNDKLKAVDIVIPEKRLVAYLLRGFNNPDLVNVLRNKLDSGTLTFNAFDDLVRQRKDRRAKGHASDLAYFFRQRIRDTFLLPGNINI
ncbi:hypothetical protein VTK56DRAFT_7842 [Thermocarpiscus australiensis]